MSRRVFYCGPCITKPRGIPVADYRFFMAFGCSPATSLSRSVRKVPGEQEYVFGRLPWSYLLLQADRADWPWGFGLGSQFTIAREVVPEKEGAVLRKYRIW